MNKKKGLLPIVLFLLTPLLVFPSIQLGQTQSITSSGIKTAKILDGASGNIKTFSLSFKEPSLGQTGQYNSFIIEGCSFTDKYGYQIPEKVISSDLPNGEHGFLPNIKNGRWQEIKGEYSPPPSPLR
ncbi:MAG: hypothetical protein N3D17_07605, partial [bacterium]|nr:hypothetical protein [bacterium]